MNGKRRILVVGAGFAGAVHARVLAESGYAVTIIDKRDHIAGNCLDEVDKSGVRRHVYGPHLFHTSNHRVVEWLSRFTGWVRYEHTVVAKLPDGRFTPLPVNLDTVNDVFGERCNTESDVQALLKRMSRRVENIRTAEDHLYSVIGPALTNLFFRPYTRKMWGRDLTEMSPDVVRRLKIRPSRNNLYFPDDTFQALPDRGYTAMFESILDHENIDISLRTPFETVNEVDWDHCFNSMPIDEYFDMSLGPLPYRSIRFHTSQVAISDAIQHPVVNYTDDGPYTRETWWHRLPSHHLEDTGQVIRTVEEPCDYNENGMERYYPINSSDGINMKKYEDYKALAAERAPHVTFIGRCGTYQYLDMHQVVNQSLAGAARWIAQSG